VGNVGTPELRTIGNETSTIRCPESDRESIPGSCEASGR